MIKLVLPKFWYKKGIISYFLLPFSFIYRFFISLRRAYYKSFASSKFQVPVIIVGNITVGGAGKTPLVIYLADLLKKQGYK
ncbi:MAG: tetraacyldisaccharide 4'-kinase, partial [Gammaproteobacteria bacterium]|nr:tetraacyldisaccharide 4'-kinase [Gammaproteobacteria bacterium]